MCIASSLALGEQGGQAVMSISPPVATFVSFFCESLLHGMYTILFLTLLHSFWKSRNAATNANPAIGIKTLTVFLYLTTTIHMAIAFRQYLYAFVINSDANQVFQHIGDATLTLIQLGIEFANGALADFILIWRVWVLFNRRYVVIILPTMLLLGSSSSAYVFLWKTSKIKGATSVFSDVFDSDLERWSIAVAVCTILTNLLCTGLIAGRIWYHNRLMKRVIGTSAVTRKYQAIILTFLESGALYSLAWVILIILDLASSAAIIPVTDIITQLTGIVPTVIVLLISRSIDYSSYSEQTLSLTNSRLSYARPGRRLPGSSISAEERSDLSISLNDIPPPRNNDKRTLDSYPLAASSALQTV